MTLVTTLDRYIVRRFAVTIASVFLLTLLLVFFVDFVEILRSGGGRDDVSTVELAAITLLRIPVLVELALPFAILIGSIGAFLSFSRTSELTIIRASGLSVWQFLQPGLAVAALLGVFAVTVYNPVAAAMKAQSEKLQASLFNTQKSIGAHRGEGAWLRQDSADGPSIIHARVSADRGLTLAGVTVLQFDLNKRFSKQIQAARAQLKEGYWLLENAVVQSAGAAQASLAEYRVSTYLSPAQVMDSVGSIESLSFWQLPPFIAFARKAGLPIERYELQYQMFLSRPLLLAAMVLIATTCSLKAFRFGKIQTMVLRGLGGGFAFFIFSELSRKVASSGLVPVTVASWGPAAIAALISITVLLYQEDG